MRKIPIVSESLKDILKQREVIFANVQEVNKKLIELDKERTKEAFKMDKLKNKVTDIIGKQKVELGEFEIYGRILLEKGEPILEVIDRVEEYKQMVREEKLKKETK